jgi:hypothetical protein
MVLPRGMVIPAQSLFHLIWSKSYLNIYTLFTVADWENILMRRQHALF